MRESLEGKKAYVTGDPIYSESDGGVVRISEDEVQIGNLVTIADASPDEFGDVAIYVDGDGGGWDDTSMIRASSLTLVGKRYPIGSLMRESGDEK